MKKKSRLFQNKKMILKKLKSSSVNLKLNTTFKKKELKKYDKVIVACYDQNNLILKNFEFKPKKKYKYELVEKIIHQITQEIKRKALWF